MRDHKKSEELAVQRFQLISPLLAEGLDAGKVKELREPDSEGQWSFRKNHQTIFGSISGWWVWGIKASREKSYSKVRSYPSSSIGPGDSSS